MKSNLTLPLASNLQNPTPHTDPIAYADVSRGARNLAIRSPAVFLEWAVLKNYAELDFTLGQNVVGVILSVLYFHQAGGGPGQDPDSIIVCLVRREDQQVVELPLAIDRRRVGGGKGLYLRRLHP